MRPISRSSAVTLQPRLPCDQLNGLRNGTPQRDRCGLHVEHWMAGALTIRRAAISTTRIPWAKSSSSCWSCSPPSRRRRNGRPDGLRTTARSIAAASLAPSDRIFLPPIRWTDQLFRFGSRGGSGFGSPSFRLMISAPRHSWTFRFGYLATAAVSRSRYRGRWREPALPCPGRRPSRL